MIKLQNIENSICLMIQLEENFPIRYENKLLSILDLEMQVQLIEEVNQPSISKLHYFYYIKPSWQVMSASSVMP